MDIRYRQKMYVRVQLIVLDELVGITFNEILQTISNNDDFKEIPLEVLKTELISVIDELLNGGIIKVDSGTQKYFYRE